ncbi:MAG: dTDP-4-amino-4,6-dideoxygalactose transaminase [Thermoleophilia bacterium]|nr:dTDP-4-amino-4,6-dideoxygalactose transaminase [Thermoleophilia bacterium]
MSDVVPFNLPTLAGRELEYIREAIANSHLSGNGPFAARCAEWLMRRTGTRKAFLTPSCTTALEMAALLGGCGPGDEVIMPSFTFSSTANAFVLRGATPVFVDIRADTLNLDERQVEAAVTARTKAIAPVHYAGVSCEMDALMDIARRHRLLVIEDAAQGILSSYRSRPLGAIGQLGAISFHETKNIICGEGGALLVNEESLLERAEIVYEKGTDRSRFFQGLVDKYSWVDVGSSYPLSEMNAAFLWAQLERADTIIARRREIWETYHRGLADLEARELIRRPVIPDGCEQNGHIYYLLLRPGARREDFIAALGRLGVRAVFHYVPLHSSAAGRRYGRADGPLPVTDDLSERLVRLPLWHGLEDATVARVIEAVHRVLQPSAT